MRVAFVVWRFPVLSEPFILNQIAGLIDRGCDVRILALNGRPTETGRVHDIVARYDLMARTTLVPARPEDAAEALAALPGALRKPARRNPRAISRVLRQCLDGLHPDPLKALWRAAALAEARSFDVVHCQFASLAPAVLRLRDAGLLRGRLVAHFRGIDITSFVAEHGPKVYERLFAEADLFLANCAFFAERARALGCPDARLHVHGSGLDLARFPFRAPRAQDGGPVRLISAGRLVEKKGFLHAVEAVARLNRERLRATYAIVGDGPERARLEARIAELGAGDAVRLLGWRDHAELSGLLADSDLFLAPCQTAADGNADAPVNTLKEAMATGLPVLATRHGGIPELVEDGASGLLVPERDPDALHGALESLIARRAHWPAMARAGRAAVERLYDARRLNDELVRLYGEIVDGGGRDAA